MISHRQIPTCPRLSPSHVLQAHKTSERIIKIGLAQINPTVGAFEANAADIRNQIQRARAQNCRVALLPEHALCGYPPLDLLLRGGFIEKEYEMLHWLAKTCGDIHAVVGFAEKNDSGRGKPLHNSMAVLHNGRITSTHQKILLPTYDVFDERRFYEPGKRVRLANIDGHRVAVTICEDTWGARGFEEALLYDRNPVAEAAAMGAEFMLNGSASPYHIGKERRCDLLMHRTAGDNHLPVFYCNMWGGNDSLIFDGQSLAVDCRGQIRGRAAAFGEDFLVAELDTKTGRIRSSLSPAQPKLELVRRALVVGTRDYAHKCGFEKAILGLSGGIDSAQTAVIGVEALGPGNVWGIGMPSGFSSRGSVTDARKLAKNLGIRFDVIPIGGIFNAFNRALKPLFKGTAFNVAEENLQARIRGTLLMALSNKFGHLLLSTGNKSEMSVGYCTLYGDMNGGLAPINDVPKTLVFDLAEYENRHEERNPWTTIHKPPSAELRPNQKDTDSLPSYDNLDAILHALVEGSLDIFAAQEQTGLPVEMVKRVYGMLDRARFKQMQGPVGLRITPKHLTSGRQIPIAQGFTREVLATLAPRRP